ncbi:MAG: LuxR family transcriptional regulator [Rhizobiales bacterium]|nr:LuxR family transcriptional regulator [Hyphomicrobiales bacterium]
MLRANVKLKLEPSVGIEKLFLPCDDEETLWEKLADFTAKEYGVTSILYAFTHSKYTVTRTGIMPSLYIRHNHPEDYIASFPAGKLTLEDSIAAEMILQGHTAFIWSDYDEMELSAAGLERVAADRAMGMGVGVSFGFRFGSGIGGMCWAARDASAADFRSMWQSSAWEMEQLADLFDRHMRPAMIRNRIRLTPRERDVLSYSAGGMTAKQIAEHLGLSPKTVANTLERARHTLGAVSTMEAVAKAIVYDLIG